MTAYRKLLMAAGAACSVAATLLADGQLSSDDLIAILSAALGAAGVWAIPNTPRADS